MNYFNAKIFYRDAFVNGSFEVKNGRFTEVYVPDSVKESTGCSIVHGEELRCKAQDEAVEGSLHRPAPCVSKKGSEEGTDLQGALVLPGLIDLHTHGNSGVDFSTCSLEELEQMAAYLGQNGITCFAPTSMTMSYDRLQTAFANAQKLMEEQQEKGPDGMARVAGIHMEGPYFSYGKRGAQNPADLKLPDFAGFLSLYEGCKGKIRLVDLAPELPGAMDFIQKASRLCTVSVAHTEAYYDTAREAFLHGAAQLTHLFNGMNGIHHRTPGPVAAAFDTPGVFAELICDGIHVKPAVIRMAFRLFPGRIILISDALACLGMPEGRFHLGDQEVLLKNHAAFLPDGTLAGSATHLFDMLKNAVSYGIPLEEAIISATRNPARQLGIYDEIGSIEAGKKADFLICSESLLLQKVFIDGQEVTAFESAR